MLPGAGGAAPALSHYWRLSPTVTACLASDRILLLDVAADRYLAVPPAHHEDFFGWLKSPGDQPPDPCLQLLGSLGVSDGAMAPPPIACFLPAPVPLDSPYLAPEGVRLSDLLSVGRAVIAARRALRSRALADVLTNYFPNATPSRPAGDLQSKLARFRCARPLVPVRRLCLHDCLALVGWLGPDAEGVTLVLGVSARPFAAHSWLQVEGRVIDDHPESPSRYQPILHLP